MKKLQQTILAFIFLAISSISAQTKKEVPFVVAKNYFVNNTFKKGDIKGNKILTSKEFEKNIGMATTMGEDGKPTTIDFTKQFVIIVVNENTDIVTNLNPNKLTINGKKRLKFAYRKDVGEKTTYTMTPFTMIIVDRKYKDYKIELSMKLNSSNNPN